MDNEKYSCLGVLLKFNEHFPPTTPLHVSFPGGLKVVLRSDCRSIPLCVVTVRGDLLSRTKSSHYTAMRALLCGQKREEFSYVL